MTHLTDTADLWMPGKPSRLHLSLAVDADLSGREPDAVREAATEEGSGQIGVRSTRSSEIGPAIGLHGSPIRSVSQTSV